MTPLDIARVQAYLRKLFSNNLIRIVPPARAGLSVEDIHDTSKFDPWFIRELSRIVDAERLVGNAESSALPRLTNALIGDVMDRHQGRDRATIPVEISRRESARRRRSPASVPWSRQ